MTAPSAESFLMSGGNKSAAFPTVGTTVAGPIKRVGDPMQQKDMATSEPKFWQDGTPMMQLPVDIITDERDPEIVNDDGTRTLYIKGQMQNAIREAVRRSGAPMLNVGGVLTITYTSDGVATRKGFNAPKNYEASYTPPSNAAAAAFINTGDQGTPDPAPATATTTAPVDLESPEVKALLAQLAATQSQPA
jgi:hypothetical protein